MNRYPPFPKSCPTCKDESCLACRMRASMRTYYHKTADIQRAKRLAKKKQSLSCVPVAE